MSYCRHNGADSNVYVFEDVGGGYTCGMCWLDPSRGEFHCADPYEMLSHLHSHIEQGHAVPARATEALREEIHRQR